MCLHLARQHPSFSACHSARAMPGKVAARKRHQGVGPALRLIPRHAVRSSAVSQPHASQVGNNIPNLGIAQAVFPGGHRGAAYPVAAQRSWISACEVSRRGIEERFGERFRVAGIAVALIAVEVADRPAVLVRLRRRCRYLGRRGPQSHEQSNDKDWKAPERLAAKTG